MARASGRQRRCVGCASCSPAWRSSPASSPPSLVRRNRRQLLVASRSDTVTCASTAGERRECPANTSGGVALLKSTGAAPCLLGKSWGYDDTGVWVADGCSGDFIVGQAPSTQTATQPAPKESPEYIPNLGFKLYSGDKGQIYMRLFSYSRFLNQKGLDATYTDFFGNTIDLQRREDMSSTSSFFRFPDGSCTPKLRYYLYVWSANTVAGRSRAGGRRRQSELRLHQFADAGDRHHQPSRRPQHRGAVPVLARRRRPPDLG